VCHPLQTKLFQLPDFHEQLVETDIAQSLGAASGFQAQAGNRGASTLPRSFTTPSLTNRVLSNNSLSPPDSQASSHTLDTNTLSNTTNTLSSATITGFPASSQPSSTHQSSQELLYCSRIPTAKRMQLLPAEQALLPQQSYSQRIVSKLPIISWFSSDVIGDTVPRDILTNEFDWKAASLYWKIMWWVDSWTGWFDIVITDKED